MHPIGQAQLRLSCSNSVAAVEVITLGGAEAVLNSIELQGKCITPDPDWTEVNIA